VTTPADLSALIAMTCPNGKKAISVGGEGNPDSYLRATEISGSVGTVWIVPRVAPQPGPWDADAWVVCMNA
jgi:hypothetical protein